ncbi:MAG: hypothetical protein HZB66_03610 [Candidatus Aenigmarchaeota archaeon]|nr:hypothetical protein [Candidatus Aenigmarchaeota archaeon]
MLERGLLGDEFKGRIPPVFDWWCRGIFLKIATEMNLMELKMTIANFSLGAVMGYVSYVLNQPLLSAATSLAAMVLLNLLLKKAWKITEEKKWWLGNAVLVFIFSWFVVWTIFYNVSL